MYKTQIDMRHRSDSNYHCIGHYIDHWSHIPDAQISTGSCNQPARQSFLPRILHSDNVREFVNSIVHSVAKEWPGDVVIVNGRPRNPKCQGLVEQGNHNLLVCRSMKGQTSHHGHAGLAKFSVS